MEQELELEVWRLAHRTCGTPAFVRLIEKGVDSFRRNPGFDPLLRLHASWIGVDSIRVLREVLKRRGIYAGPAAGYVELRSRLNLHLRGHLQLHLMEAGQATEEMKADQLGRDLGL